MNEERRLAAIMFSDICNFSRIMENNEKRALEIVELAFSCISQAVEQYNGRIIKKNRRWRTMRIFQRSQCCQSSN
jgi:class 3 adenylate cyclase